MSGKIMAVCLGVAVLGSIGCTGEFVSREIYDRDVKQLKQYNEAMEQRIADLQANRPQGDWSNLDAETAKTYAELAETLKRALAGMDVPVELGKEVIVKPWGVTLSDKLLNFASGKFEVNARGKEIIKAIAQTHHNSMFRLVGHTDMKPIIKPDTKAKLITDTNNELSVLRAVAVMGEFLKHNIRENQFASIEGHGWMEPKGSAESSRRVEIFFVGDASELPAPRTVKTSAKKVSNR